MLKIEVTESHYKPVIIWYDGIPSILLSTSTLLQRHFNDNFNATSTPLQRHFNVNFNVTSMLTSTTTSMPLQCQLQRHFNVNFNALLKQVADNVEVY